MRWGTSHFVSRSAAERYYSAYEADPARAVARKLADGEIHIGKPMTCEPDETVTLDRSEGRYFIERGPRP